MKLKKVLVVYKKSSFSLYARERRDSHFIRTMRQKHLASRRFLASHRAHERSIRQVREALNELGIASKFVYRAHSFSEKGYDLILTVGGDGTFLEASHKVLHTPLLGINSSPKDSVGIFCSGSADRLKKVLRQIREKQLKPSEISRLAVRVNGRNLLTPVLNDLLVSHDNPAATSRYILCYKRLQEEQKSSGIWISTAVGSTAAVEGAGGVWMPIQSRSFQFKVREPYELPGKRYVLKGAVVPAAKKIVIYSKMRTGRIYMDGPHLSFPFPFSAKLEVSTTAPKLKVFAFNESRRKHF